MNDILFFFTEPLSHGFMQRALLAAVLISSVCAIFSCFLVLKGWSLMGDAVSHAVLPGLALAYVIGAPLLIGAFLAGLFCAVATGYIKDNSRVKEDAVMGIVFSGMFALGLVMLTKIESEIHLMHILFGNVLGMRSEDLFLSSVIALVAGVIMLLKRKDLMLVCFDPAHASVVGLPVKKLSFLLLCLLAVTIVSALNTAGIILVIAFLIAPGATGFLMSRSFDTMVFCAIGTALLSSLAGTILSFHLDVATAPLIVVIQFALFCVALCTHFITSKTKGRAS